MVKATGVIGEFTSLDGLKVDIYLQVTDEQGAADVVADDILDNIRDAIAQLDDFIEAQRTYESEFEEEAFGF